MVYYGSFRSVDNFAVFSVHISYLMRYNCREVTRLGSRVVRVCRESAVMILVTVVGGQTLDVCILRRRYVGVYSL